MSLDAWRFVPKAWFEQGESHIILASPGIFARQPVHVFPP